MKSDKALFVILTTVALDAAGIGLIMPVLPGLLRTLGADQVARHYGVLLALYALMQFLCAPLLGALSDRHGRRPVLLASLAGAALDYAVMAVAPALWVLYLGRAVAGLTGATGAVASSCIADLSRGEDRARRYGYLSACMGLGLIAGPVIGGLAGQWSPHAPFAVAAALNALNCLMAWRFLPESRPASDHDIGRNNPRRRWHPRGSRAPGAQSAGRPALEFAACRRCRRCCWPTCSRRSLARCLDPCGCCTAKTATTGTPPWSACPWRPSACCMRWRRPCCPACHPAFRRARQRQLGLLGRWLRLRADRLRDAGLDGVSNPVAAGAGRPGRTRVAGAARSRPARRARGSCKDLWPPLAGLTSVIGPLCVTALYAAPGQGWNGWPWLAGAALNQAGLALLLRRAKPARDLSAGNEPATARQRQ